MDFLAIEPARDRTLFQVAADLSDKATRDREFRALADALPAHRRTQAVLLTLTGSDVLAAQGDAPPAVAVWAAWEWMLEE